MLNEISLKLQAGKAKIVKELVQQAIDAGIAPQEILEKGLLAGMDVIGEKFKNNEVFVPEVLVAARAMNFGMAVLKPLLVADGVKNAGKVCIGTIQGDNPLIRGIYDMNGRRVNAPRRGNLYIIDGNKVVAE